MSGNQKDMSCINRQWVNCKSLRLQLLKRRLLELSEDKRPTFSAFVIWYSINTSSLHARVIKLLIRDVWLQEFKRSMASTIKTICIRFLLLVHISSAVPADASQRKEEVFIFPFPLPKNCFFFFSLGFEKQLQQSNNLHVK